MATVRTFDANTRTDALGAVNAYTVGWPHTRPVDNDLVAHWETLGAPYQPGRIRIAYAGGHAVAFCHGELDGAEYDVHLLATRAEGLAVATDLLALAEEEAVASGATRICGPHWRSNMFYGGYLLGCEPYHPHWACAATDAYVRSGWRISHAGVIMQRTASRDASAIALPAGYDLFEDSAPRAEFAARTFRLAARLGGEEVATCTGRVYPGLPSGDGGGAVGQIGFVGTHERHRGRGLARGLVELAVRRLSEWGAAEILIATGLDNAPALRAYERAGFRRRHHICEWSKHIGVAAH